MGRDFYLFIYSLIGWLVGFPLALLIPVKPNTIAIIGRQDGKFIDSAKYFYLYVNSLRDIDFYFLTEQKDVYKKLKDKNLPVLLYPSFKSVFKLLRTSVVVMDDGRWMFKSKYHLLLKARKVQIWHGIPLKQIDPIISEVNNLKSFFKNLRFKFQGRSVIYDLFISTSEFYTENAFRPAFTPKQIIESGYPRNDIMFREPDELDLLETDSENIQKIKDFKNQGYKIILYVPTFRDRGGDAITDNALDLARLSDFSKEHKIIFVFKFHPLPDCKYNVNYENIIMYDNEKDVYPVFKDADLMITDYSSIYLDYLLLDKPVIFFPYDYEEYISRHHKLKCDYNWVTPGPKCTDQSQLEQELVKFTQGLDEYAERRTEVNNVSFKYHDGKASERIWDFIRHNWLKG